MKSKSTWKHILNYLRSYVFLVLLSIIFAIVSVVITLYIPIEIGKSIDLIIDIGKVDFKNIVNILTKVGIMTIIVALLQWIMNIINNKIVFNVIQDIRNKAFIKIQRLPLSYLDTKSTGEIVSRIISDADQFADGLLLGFTQLFTSIVTIAGTLMFMASINIGITAVVVFLTPLTFILAKFVASKTYSMFKMQSEIRGEQTAFIDEIISGQKVVKAFRREEEAKEKFKEINDRLEKWSLKAIFYSSITNPCTRFINNIVYAAVALVGALLAIKGSITIGLLTSFLSYVNQYTKPFNEISGVITEFQNALACATRLFNLIDEREETKDSSKDITNVQGNISFENVQFSYVKNKKLIENLNIDVKAGQHVAIVGPTGSGKTTLINLLMRFYDVTSGSIKVEQQDIRNISRNSLRKNYGMVLQDTWLKSGTVRENIKMGNPNATDEEMIEATKSAYAHRFIKQLPNGYDTVLKENAQGLSQGQKQLLCIARIMLSLPPMLILDEATSSIDTRTELRIQQAFSTMMKGRTTFIVAHRLSTIRESDLILVMKEGNIIEQGNHQELLEKGGFYYNLWNSQFAK